jgi:hypothetical protein
MPKKVCQYISERKEILDKILTILGIDDENKIFRLEEISEENQETIYKLEKEIKKYFKTTGWNCYKQKDIVNRWLSLIRSILKEYNGEIITKRKSSKKGDMHETIMEYYVIFNM